MCVCVEVRIAPIQLSTWHLYLTSFLSLKTSTSLHHMGIYSVRRLRFLKSCRFTTPDRRRTGLSLGVTHTLNLTKLVLGSCGVKGHVGLTTHWCTFRSSPPRQSPPPTTTRPGLQQRVFPSPVHTLVSTYTASWAFPQPLSKALFTSVIFK